MDALVVGVAFVGSCATAFVMQRAVLSAVMRVLERGKIVRTSASSAH